ncbi:NAD-specific glutamate dehydrogenase [Austwickia sp. TVS 96-490-7B]|uniref:NAD-glutamate dehydrogenase n=1 Tax=Austwickia sp. TVS 96-490-7B TaxID=2830843 RepID=UPI001C55B59D|nr:NAD-glutamate dehydrogenase [Austwickia sp. TVS 96-490-7B]MBW3086805.1 NAD-specific glutamate dehydrogenase [Austwickia sp. TVS 96-490-7B]
MIATLEESRHQSLHSAAQLAGRGGGEPIERLLTRYYRHVVTEDILARRPEDLLGAALSHRALAVERPVGTVNVHVFTPTVEQEGWTTGHTVIEIVTDDMPFLVDSVSSYLARHHRSVHHLVHPQLVVRRDAAGNLQDVLDLDPQEAPDDFGVGVESWMHLQIDRESDATAREELTAGLQHILSDVRVAVEDWPKMTDRARVIAQELVDAPPVGADLPESTEAADLLRWLADGQFTFLGYREYTLDENQTDGHDQLVPVHGTGLGLMRYDSESPAAAHLNRLSGAAAAKAREPEILVVTKANTVSTVHRPVYLDYVGIKSFDDTGRVVGERRFVGLFTGGAYTHSVTRIPYVAQKVRRIIASSGFAPESHLAKDLLGVLENYPRDELFQSDVSDLAEIATSVVHLRERRQPRLFLRKDDYGRFMSCLVYIPRDRYNTTVRLRLEALLRKAFRGESVEFTTLVSESVLARLHFVVRVAPGSELPDVNVDDLQRQVRDATRTWEEDLSEGARSEYGEETASRLLSRWSSAFPEAYKEDFQARVAVADLRHVEDLRDPGELRLNLYHAPGAPAEERRLKLYRRGPLSLTELLPIFTDMGLEVTDERPYALEGADGTLVHIYDFGLRASSPQVWSVGADGARQRFQEAFQAVWSGHAESDGFNALVLSAGVDWRQVVILRAVAKYQRQAGTPFTQSFIEGTLTAHATIARLLVELFGARFDPDQYDESEVEERDAAQEAITERIMSALDEVASLDQDRILRTFLGVIQATLRTNYYQQPRAGSDGVVPEVKPTVCFKLDPKAVPGLPAPRPMFEIWVYSPRVEGVHLRFGKVARGGLRWSDRREDFRTEILGLVKAQMVKNAVIVPTGSKGGFFAKQLPDPSVDRDAWLAEGIASYQLFISSLLDVTDNRVGGQIIPPERVVRHDPDDPYLVVAADKGTAKFSDIANGVAQSYGFWLDDAFASGGSAGYDHKGMGITARGAWESVKRHFREMGIDCQTQEFTAVGIGDMSGDVFGNGMLLSPCTRLVAAFDHRHIFLDPTPDAVSSEAERRRLFDLPRSSWADYDASLISDGGGIFPRTAKSIPVSPQVRAALGMAQDVESVTPAELMKAILLAPVDLLWNGGIGTYVKASAENDGDIGDRANDAIRVDGRQLRCRVIGEGGNLGCSQLGRIEAAGVGVRVNTDAIDNSAGVDTSDHEVNIKILLTGLTREGDMTLKQRNSLLASMTDDVAAMVLRDNYEQNVLLGNARNQRSAMLPVHTRFIHWLEERGDLDRALEFLPDESEIARRLQNKVGLESPELCVLVAYAKLALKADLLEGSMPDEPWFTRTLTDYFPPAIREEYGDQLDTHPLKREIIVNSVANSLVNRGGITFVFRAMEETGASPEQIARAFVIAREVFDLRGYVEQIEALDTVVPTDVQTHMYLIFRRLLDRAVRWFLQRRPGQMDVAAEIERFSGAFATLSRMLPESLVGTEAARHRAEAAELMEQGVPEGLALHACGLLDLFSVLDVVELAHECDRSVESVAALYFATSEHFGVDELLKQVAGLPRGNRWDALARGAMRDDLYSVLESLTRSILSSTEETADAEERLATWLTANADAMERMRSSLGGITDVERPGLAPLSVALRTLRGIARAGLPTA